MPKLKEHIPLLLKALIKDGSMESIKYLFEIIETHKIKLDINHYICFAIDYWNTRVNVLKFLLDKRANKILIVRILVAINNVTIAMEIMRH